MCVPGTMKFVDQNVVKGMIQYIDCVYYVYKVSDKYMNELVGGCVCMFARGLARICVSVGRWAISRPPFAFIVFDMNNLPYTVHTFICVVIARLYG